MKKRPIIALVLAALLAPLQPFAQAPKLKVGFMLPYSGTYAALGDAIEKGISPLSRRAGRQDRRARDRVREAGRRAIKAKATDNANKLIKRDNVDVLVGTVHSGVAMAMAKVAKDNSSSFPMPAPSR